MTSACGGEDGETTAGRGPRFVWHRRKRDLQHLTLPCATRDQEGVCSAVSASHRAQLLDRQPRQATAACHYSPTRNNLKLGGSDKDVDGMGGSCTMACYWSMCRRRNALWTPRSPRRYWRDARAGTDFLELRTEFSEDAVAFFFHCSVHVWSFRTACMSGYARKQLVASWATKTPYPRGISLLNQCFTLTPLTAVFDFDFEFKSGGGTGPNTGFSFSGCFI